MALFIGGIGPALGDDGPLRWFIGGLVGVLVLAAGIVLAFTGRYPAPLYDVAVGMDRWALRVAAYAGLMTDAYPPFRLDTGGTDPASGPVRPPVAPPPGEPVSAGWASAPPVTATPAAWTGLRVTAVVAGAVMTLVGTGLLAAGGVAMWADRTQRTDGLLVTSIRHYDIPGHALVSEHIDLPDLDLGPLGPDSLLGTVRIELAAGDGSERFLGVARTEDVRAYLGGVPHATVSDLTGVQEPVATSGDRVPGEPTAADLWVASASGPTPQTLTWDSSGGNWTFVVMQPDGAAGFDATLRAGAEVPALPWIAAGALGVGGLVVLGGLVLMVVPATRASHRGPTVAPAREFTQVS